MSPRIPFASTFIGLALILNAARAADSYVWWEGESPLETNYPKDTTFAANTPSEKDKLSGGDWLETSKPVPGQKLFAKYEVEAPADAEYHFWARVFYHHGPFRWHFDDGAWQTCDNKVALADSVELRKFLCANWKACGSVKLTAGKHTLHIELLAEPGQGVPTAFDCFLLTPQPFTPRGKKKPGEKYDIAPDGWFAFEPDRDSFQPTPLDLRGLNEKEAGSKGWLQADGDHFAFEKDKTPVRFWAVNIASETIERDRASIDYLARKLAKLGVNMVRFHGYMYDRNATDPSQVDPKRLDGLQYLVAAMKKNGIYTKISYYFPLWFNVKPGYGLPGYEKIENKKPFALLFFHPRMQEIHRAWLKTLLTAPNPHTGVPMGQDPAVPLVEIINEDNYFFWTFAPGKNIPPECMPPLEQKFAAWLTKKYGSMDEVRKAWKNDGIRSDGSVELTGVWNLTDQAKGKRNETRAHDQVRFLTEDLRAFHEATQAYITKDLGYKGLVTASNWTTADNRVLLALDKYTNLATDVLDRHGYLDTGGLGKGQQYENRSALLQPTQVPLTEVQYARKPHIMSEINWQPPNRFRADLPLLQAAYGALQGNDCPYFFCVGCTDWLPCEVGKCTVFIPVIMGQFPATAMLYRQGYVKEGPVVSHSALKLSELYELKGTPLPAETNTDERLKREGPPPTRETDAPSAIDPLAGYVGQVTVEIGEEPGKSRYTDLGSFIDRGAKTVKSATGELAWNWGTGFAAVNTPRAQGATGFLQKAGTIELADAKIESGNEYGTVLVASLDGKPLKESARMLLQVMTEQTNYGWKTKGDKKLTIEDVGGPPLLVRNVAGTVSLKRADASALKVTPLDLNGYPKEPLAGGAAKVSLKPDVLYYLIEK